MCLPLGGVPIIRSAATPIEVPTDSKASEVVMALGTSVVVLRSATGAVAMVRVRVFVLDLVVSWSSGSEWTWFGLSSRGGSGGASDRNATEAEAVAGDPDLMEQ
jgi:hypothetical protein